VTLFNTAFTFYVDPSVIDNSPSISISSIGLYFMYRPSPTQNMSGLQNPGVTMYLVDTVNDVPNVANTVLFQNNARCEWNEINTSSDASVETLFTFRRPISVVTGKKYAIILNYDGNENFNLWTNRRGYNLVGTTTPSTGPSSPYGGSLFNASSLVQSLAELTAHDVSTLWTPVVDVDVKFNVYCARFAVNGEPVFALGTAPDEYIYSPSIIFDYDEANNVVMVEHPSPRIENIQFDPILSLKQAYVGPQKSFQYTIFYPGGGVTATVSSSMSKVITAAATLSNSAPFSWDDVFGTYTGDKYIVIWDTDSFNIRKVVTVASNTQIVLDANTTFINSASYFMITPVATIDSFNESYLTGKKNSLMFLRDSNANSSVRFVGDAINHANVTISSGGTGYSNDETIFIVGYDYVANKIVGNYPAEIKLQTNTSGGVNSIAFANIGAGFSNVDNIQIVVANSITTTANNESTNTANGSGLSLNIVVGSTILTEHVVNKFRGCKVLDVGISDCYVSSDILQTSNSSVINYITTTYYTEQDNTVPGGWVSYVGPQTVDITLNKTLESITWNKTPSIVSRSNEFVTKYSGGADNDQVDALNPYSNCVVISYDIKFNNDYVVPGPFESPVVNFGRYIINDDWTNEQTNSGNALAKVIMQSIQFQGQVDPTKQSEDVVVYITGWRPPGTDIKVYARIKNNYDSEAFDDEDWSLLKMSANNISPINQVELTYGFTTEPNTTPMVGTITTTNNSANVTGSNTDFSGLVQGDFVKIFDPLFVESGLNGTNANFVIAMVNSTPTDNTTLIIDTVFSTNTELGIGGPELADVDGLNIAKVDYPHQAYTYIQNDNIVQYYNLTSEKFMDYGTIQLKILLLSDNFTILPHISSVRCIGLSA